jgi:nucleotide-binding universal stress UspA family protein
MTATTIEPGAGAPAVRTRSSLARWASHSLVIARRNLITLVRMPEIIVFAAIQPIMFVLLFRYVFGGAISVRGMSYVNFLVPGIVIQMVAFNAFGTALGINEDANKGLLDRLRSLPMSRSAFLTGRILADTVRVIFSIVLLTIVGFMVGFRIESGIGPALLAFVLAVPRDVEFLAGVFAFGSMIAFALAHLSVIVLRFRESDRPSAFRVPLSIPVRGARVPLPAVFGFLLSVLVWASVVAFHEGGRIIGFAWMAVGVTLYVLYRRGQDKPLRKRFTIPAEALQETTAAEYGSILVPVFGEELDDDIVGTAGRLATSAGEDDEGGAVLEALFVFEIPMSLPIDARVPDERVQEAKRVLARAKEVGEEYEGVEVATAMVRGRTAGQAIVAEARRRGVEAIVLGAEEPSRLRGGAILGGRGRVRDRFVGETTRYVIEKAPCKVILTAPPAGEEGTREGVLP